MAVSDYGNFLYEKRFLIIKSTVLGPILQSKDL